VNHRALQRALVIALHDPDFTDFASLPGLGAAELAQLAGIDPRARRTDPLRRRRLLRTLAEEYKASTTLLLAETRALADLDAFFSSAAFRAAVMADRSLAVALAEHLRALAARAPRTPQLPGVLALEATRAACRRDAQRAARPGVGLAPGVAVLELDAAVLPAIQAVERYLFEIGLMPQVALADDAPRLPALGALTGRVEHYLLSPAEGDIALAPIDAALHRVLAALREPRARKDAVAAVGGAGVPAARAGELVDSLLLEGLLAEGPPPGAPLLADAR
jgi:hypothetical protein